MLNRWLPGCNSYSNAYGCKCMHMHMQYVALSHGLFYIYSQLVTSQEVLFRGW